MPELPEVETIARALRHGGRGAPSVLHRRIDDIVVDDPRLLADEAVPELQRRYCGAVLERVWRRAKYLVLETSAGPWVFHLRMTGDLTVDPGPAAPHRHQRLRVALEGGLQLRFTDPRRLGRMWCATEPDLLFAGLGPEPLDDSLSESDLATRLVSSRSAIKTVLLNPARIAGLGNIWADEALFVARIDPRTPAHLLTPDAQRRLVRGIRTALSTGIERCGRGLHWVHRGPGVGTPPGEVHLRAGQPCPRCGTSIEKVRIGGRSSYFCPTCQPRGPTSASM